MFLVGAVLGGLWVSGWDHFDHPFLVLSNGGKEEFFVGSFWISQPAASVFRVSVSSPLLGGYDEPETLRYEIKSDVPWPLMSDTSRGRRVPRRHP